MHSIWMLQGTSILLCDSFFLKERIMYHGSLVHDSIEAWRVIYFLIVFNQLPLYKITLNFVELTSY